jgi:hypothetical protein
MERFSNLADQTDRIIDSCLEAAGDAALPYVRDGLSEAIGKNTKLPSRATGELVGALGVSPPKTNKQGVRDIKIGFNEPRRDGRPNALVANVLEYGKSGQPPKPFLKNARNKSRHSVEAAIEAQFDEEAKKL